MSVKLDKPEDYAKLLENYDTWLFDCDGVIWNGDRIVPGAKEVLSLLRQQKKQIIFVTNNATKSRKKYKKKFDSLDIQVTEDEIFGSAYAAAVYISSVLKLPKEHKVYVIGTDGLEEELANEGVSYLGGTSPEDNVAGDFDVSAFKPDPSVVAVLCGLDTSITYTKLAKAFIYLTRPAYDCPGGRSTEFLVTNEDPTYPTGYALLPGAGSISAPLRFSLKRDPLSLGKPSAGMMECIRAKHKFDSTRAIMVGDRLDTDIAFGKMGKLSTLLVLTGVTDENEVESAGNPVPDYVIQSIGELQVITDL